MNFCEVKASNQPTSIIKFSIAVQQCLKAILEKQAALVQSPARLRANVPSDWLRAANYVLLHGVAGSRGAAHKKAGTHRFCAAKLLALKSIGFLMTGKKKAHRNAPAFQALFSQHGAKRLTFKRCLLAFLWAQFAFLLQAFSFSNKKIMPKRGKYKIFDCCRTRG